MKKAHFTGFFACIANCFKKLQKNTKLVLTSENYNAILSFVVRYKTETTKKSLKKMKKVVDKAKYI